MKRVYNQMPSRRAVVFGGAVSGVIAGLAMGVFSMLRHWLAGEGFFLPLKMIAGVFYGVEALIGGAWVITVGLLTHMVVAGTLGSVFAMLTQNKRKPGVNFFFGLLFGIGVWAVMTFLVLPVANPVMSERVDLINGWWFFNHLIFGSFLALTPQLEEEVDRQMETTHIRAA